MALCGEGVQGSHVWYWQHRAVRVSNNLALPKTLPRVSSGPLFNRTRSHCGAPSGVTSVKSVNAKISVAKQGRLKAIRKIKSFKRFVIPVLKGVLPGLNPSGDSSQVAVERNKS